MFGISFLYPAFLIGALSVAVPIVLHLLRRETAPQVLFSAVRFLRRAPVERVRRKRLRELLLLALRVSALLLLAFAFARPYLGAADAASTAVTMVAVDTSFSMGAPGQFERARDLARAVINSVPAGDRVGVVAFNDTADLVVEPTGHRRTALAALERLGPSAGATRYRPALAKAGAAIGAARGRVVVVTDLQRTGWEADDEGAVPAQIAVDVADIGLPGGNLAVVAIQPQLAQTVATVVNGGTAAQTAEARLLVDGRTVATGSLTLAPGTSGEVRFPVVLPPTGVASVTIDDRTGALADNVRYLVLDPPEPAALLAISSTGDTSTDALYLDRALVAGSKAPRFRLTAVSGGAVTALAPERLHDQAAVLLLATRGLDRRGREALASYLQDGGRLLVVAGPEVEPAVVAGLAADSPRFSAGTGAAGGDLRLAPVDLRHPIFRPFGPLVGNLGQVRFRRTLGVQDAGGAVVIGRFSDGGPALLEYGVGTGRILLFASDLNNRWNDFPLHPTFVPFVHETLRYLARERQQPREFVLGATPAGIPREPGVAAVLWSGRRVAINVDLRESDLARVSPQEFEAAVARLRRAGVAVAESDATQREERQHVWWYGLLAVGLVLAGEGLLGSRMA